MKPIDTYKRLGKLQKSILWGLILLIAYTVFGFLILPPITRIVAEKQLTKMVGRPLTIQKIKMNPFTLTMNVSGLKFSNKDATDPLLAFSSLYVNLQSVSIFKLAPVVKELRLEKPYLHIVQQEDYQLKDSFNFSDLLILQPFLTKEETDTPEAEKETSEPFRFSINNIQVTDGKIEVDDLPVQKNHIIDSINIGIPFVSNFGQNIEIFVQPHFSANINGAPFELDGKTKPFSDSRQTEVDIDLKDIDMPYYFTYSPVRSLVKLLDGSLDIQATLAFVQNSDGSQQAFLSGAVTIKDLDINDLQDNPLARIARIEMQLARSELLSGKVHFDKLHIESPELGVTRNDKKETNVFGMMNSFSQESSPPAEPQSEGGRLFSILLDTLSVSNARVYIADQYPTASGNPADVNDLLTVSSYMVNGIAVSMEKSRVDVAEVVLDGGALKIHRQKDDSFNFQALIPPAGEPAPAGSETETPAASPAGSGSPWIVNLKSLAVDNFQIEALQLAPDKSGDFTLDDFHLGVKNFTNERGVPTSLDLSMKINDKSALTTSGEMVIAPLSATLNTDIKDLNIAWFQPFIKDYVTVVVSDGKLSANCSVTASMTADTGPTAKIKGGVSLANLSVLEDGGAKKLLTWKKLDISGIDAGYEPTFAKIKAITVDQSHSRIYLDKNGKPNVLRILKEQKDSTQPAASPAGKPAELPPVSIAKMALRSGQVDFTDNSAKPVFSTTIDKVSLEATGLSTDKNSRAAFSFSGRMAGHAPLKIEGDINPLSENLYLNLALIFQNMDLTAFGPYSGRYAGYTIHKGKLSLDLGYKLEKDALEASNKIIVDQFEFGDKVESEDAVDLPVKLGVSLLKDRNGRIDLDIPLGGRLDDPEFSIGGIVLDVIGNLLVKAATAPFSLIASMFGSEEDLQHIEFEPGTAELNEAAVGKLDTLTTALYERPQLSLDISGFCDETLDKTALLETAFDKMIKSVKIQEITDDGDPPPALEEIVIPAEEYGEIITDLHDELVDNKQLEPMSDEEEDTLEAKMDAAEDGGADDQAVEEMEIKYLEDRIRSTIQVTDGELRLLARNRSEAVMKYLLDSEKVEAGRLFLADPPELTPEKVEGLKESRVALDLR